VSRVLRVTDTFFIEAPEVPGKICAG
jgi:hypothetical protein